MPIIKMAKQPSAQKVKAGANKSKKRPSTRGVIYITNDGFRQHVQQLLLNLVDNGGKAHAVCMVVLLKRVLSTMDKTQAKELQKTIFVDDKVVKANPECLRHPVGCICGHAPPSKDELTALYWEKAGSPFPS